MAMLMLLQLRPTIGKKERKRQALHVEEKAKTPKRLARWQMCQASKKNQNQTPLERLELSASRLQDSRIITV
jgi:hypothetical protein